MTFRIEKIDLQNMGFALKTGKRGSSNNGLVPGLYGFQIVDPQKNSKWAKISFAAVIVWPSK